MHVKDAVAQISMRRALLWNLQIFFQMELLAFKDSVIRYTNIAYSYITYNATINLFQGNCEKTIQDVVERFWDIIEDININKVLLFLRDNIVGTVVLVTALLWIPAACVIGYVDRKRRREEEERWAWKSKRDLIHPSEPKKVIHIRVPRPRNIPAGTHPTAQAVIPEEAY